MYTCVCKLMYCRRTTGNHVRSLHARMQRSAPSTGKTSQCCLHKHICWAASLQSSLPGSSPSSVIVFPLGCPFSICSYSSSPAPSLKLGSDLTQRITATRHNQHAALCRVSLCKDPFALLQLNSWQLTSWQAWAQWRLGMQAVVPRTMWGLDGYGSKGMVLSDQGPVSPPSKSRA